MRKIILYFLICFNCLAMDTILKKIPTALESFNCESLYKASKIMDTENFLMLLRFNLELSKIVQHIKFNEIAQNILLTSRPDYMKRIYYNYKNKHRPIEFFVLAYIFPGVIDLNFIFPHSLEISDEYIRRSAISYFKSKNKSTYNTLHGKSEKTILAFLDSLKEFYMSENLDFLPTTGYQDLKDEIKNYGNSSNFPVDSEETSQIENQFLEFYKFTREFEPFRNQAENLTDENILNIVEMFLRKRRL
ncbi:MAG: hypothetical protein H6622_17680 [Halobacteriovoraceae bacterium]|nr:hypothetical protein [Halobacteriovoraceae bacterium]